MIDLHDTGRGVAMILDDLAFETFREVEPNVMDTERA